MRAATFAKFGVGQARLPKALRAKTVGRSGQKPLRRVAVDVHAQVGLVMSTMTGHTAEYADIVKEKLGDSVSDPVDIGEIQPSDLTGFDGFIVGAPTWHTGADVGRSGTAWDDVLAEIAGLDMGGKPCAVFGLGDGVGYSDNFVDAIEEVHEAFSKAGCKMVGYTKTDTYDFSESKSINADGLFMGLPLDYDNEDDKADDRITAWCEQLKGEMGL